MYMMDLRNPRSEVADNRYALVVSSLADLFVAVVFDPAAGDGRAANH
jgi:hypothetical protein